MGVTDIKFRSSALTANVYTLYLSHLTGPSLWVLKTTYIWWFPNSISSLTLYPTSDWWVQLPTEHLSNYLTYTANLSYPKLNSTSEFHVFKPQFNHQQLKGKTTKNKLFVKYLFHPLIPESMSSTPDFCIKNLNYYGNPWADYLGSAT